MNKSILTLTLALAVCAGCTIPADETRYVDTFDLSGAVSGYGAKTRAGKSVAGNPLTLKGKVYARGFGDHPESALAFEADGKVLAFEATVGLDDDSMEAAKGSYGKPTGEFKGWADGKVVWRSGYMKPGDEPKAVRVDLAGAKEIVLESTSGGEWTACNAVHADWADARFICAGDAKLRRLTDPSRTAQLGIQTPKAKDEPQFNGADIWGVRPGRPVIFRVPVSGLRPMVFTAKNLPDGVTLDAKGVLRGTAPAAKGDYDIEVTAENAKGKASRTIRLAVGVYKRNFVLCPRVHIARLGLDNTQVVGYPRAVIETLLILALRLDTLDRLSRLIYDARRKSEADVWHTISIEIATSA